MILFVLILVFLSLVYFVLSEMSLVASDEARLRSLALKSGGRYEVVRSIRSKPDIFFSTILVGINLATVLFSMLLTREVGVKMGMLLSTVIIALFGEIVVKSVAIVNPEFIASFVSPLIYPFYWLFYPLIFIVKGIGDGGLKLFGISRESREKITKEEMKVAAKEARIAGGIDEEQYRAMSSIYELSDKDVRDIMVPRVEIKAVEFNENKDNIIKILKETEVAKLPVYKGTIDNITGILFKKDIIFNGGEWNIIDKLRPVKFIHGEMNLEQVLSELLSDKNGCAIVIDEYGGTEGFVSTDDILFSIFERELEIKNMGEGSFIVSGDIRPQKLGIETDLDTLAGYIENKLQEIPAEGKKLKIEGMEMTVLDATDRKIKKVLIKKE